MDKHLFQEKKEEFNRYFKDLWSDSKPLLKLFRTDGQGYVYDTGTNRIFACSNLEFVLLNSLISMDLGKALDKIESLCSSDEFLKTASDIQTAIAEKNILKTKKIIEFGLGSHFEATEEYIKTQLEMVQLEVTERCNLRCEYCLYNPHYEEKRNHGTKDMKLDTAYRAIDYLARSSLNREDVAVTFYGGEPLIKFPLIKSCVQYAHRVLGQKGLHFALTTNATLITSS